MKWMVLAVIAVIIAGGCSPGKTYERRLKRELASGVRYDSLFMGISFGMTDEAFYKHCWKLNQDGLIRQGTGNQTVLYEIKEELEHPATMNFYPKFENGIIVELPVRFVYNGWAPWNKELTPAKLAEDVKNWYEDIYGNGFITIVHPLKGTAYTKIDGNRRITIYNENELYVWAVFTDMLSGVEKDSLQEANQN